MCGTSPSTWLSSSQFVRRLWAAFEVSVAVWVVTGVILAVPHGPGHSIESMGPVRVLNLMAFRVGVGSLAALIGLLVFQLTLWVGERIRGD